MNRIIASATLLALLAVGRGGLAAEATGWIIELDKESDRLTLDDGQKYGVSEDINFGSLKDGVRVRIQYSAYGKERTVTDIELAPGEHPPGSGVPLCDRSQSKSRNISKPATAGAVC